MPDELNDLHLAMNLQHERAHSRKLRRILAVQALALIVAFWWVVAHYAGLIK
jgi:hypothetical protein